MQDYFLPTFLAFVSSSIFTFFRCFLYFHARSLAPWSPGCPSVAQLVTFLSYLPRWKVLFSRLPHSSLETCFRSTLLLGWSALCVVIIFLAPSSYSWISCFLQSLQREQSMWPRENCFDGVISISFCLWCFLHSTLTLYADSFFHLWGLYSV